MHLWKCSRNKPGFLYLLWCYHRIDKSFQGFEHLEAQMWGVSCRAFSYGCIRSSLILLGFIGLLRILRTLYPLSFLEIHHGPNTACTPWLMIVFISSPLKALFQIWNSSMIPWDNNHDKGDQLYAHSGFSVPNCLHWDHISRFHCWQNQYFHQIGAWEFWNMPLSQ